MSERKQDSHSSINFIHKSCQGLKVFLSMQVPQFSGGGALHNGVRQGCAPVLGSFWPGISGIGIHFYLTLSVIGVYFHM